MKIAISYPPIESDKGIPEISQNRQFNWFNSPTYVYPMVPAYAATMLKDNSYEVFWDDGIAEELTLAEYMERISREQPDIIVMETKTPVIKTHWRIIDALKANVPGVKVALVGDHVTALPRESFEKCGVDYVLTGGDYDFLLLNLCQYLTKGKELEPGIWYRENGEIRNTGAFQLNHDLNSLPFIDRELTRWQLYSEKNGNYKDLPGSYVIAGRDCWWHKCTFCAWTVLYPQFRVRTPESVVDEIGMLIEKYQVKEIFDDTGTFPAGEWLESFCKGMIDRGYNHKIRIGCNLRYGKLNQEQYSLMRKAGFRYLLFGLESANQESLDHINKGIRVNDIINGCRMAKKVRLEPHLTVMIGFPWETKEDAIRTVNLAKEIFRQGYADTLQATIAIPYPGTPLFNECQAKGWLTTQDWDDYDMRQPVMKTPMSEADIKQATQELYKVFFTPRYMFRRLLSIRSLSDVKFISRGARKVFGHLKDFATENQLPKQ